MGLKRKQFNCGMLPIDIIFYCGKEDLFIKLMYRLYKEIIPKGKIGWCININNGTQIIWSLHRDPYIISHEAVHASENILRFIGIEGLGEVGAYLAEFILRNCMGVR